MTESPGIAGSIVRVRFLAAAPAGAAVLAEFNELARVAVVEPMAAGGSRVSVPKDGPADALEVLRLPGGSAAPPEVRQQAETWLGSPGHPGIVDLVLQSDRIVWRPGRALVIGAAVDFEAYLRGLASFSLHEGELRRLESEVAGWWRIADTDVALTHQVDGAAVRRWAHVNEMTAAVTRARFRHVAIEEPLEKGPAALSGLARRLSTELALRTDVADRLARLDDKIDVLADLYELANDRISEFSYFRREFILEILIVAVLAFEAALLLYDLL